MSATYDPATDVGRVRIRIMDRKLTSPAFSDEEIQAVISDEGGWRGAVVALARNLMIDKARFARVFSNAEGSMDEGAGLAALQAVIDQYAAQTTQTLPTVLVRTLGSHPMDPYDNR